MDSWKAWAVLFISTCVMAVVLAYLDYWEAAVGTVSISFGLGIVLGLLGYLRRGREIRHHERMAMIEKGIYIEARKHDSGVPSLLVVLLVGIGLATVIASDVEFFGFVLLFVGIGLIVRSRLLHNRNQEQAGLQQVRPGPVPGPGPDPGPGADPGTGPSADPGTGEQTTGKKNGG
ncbi:MAG: hypothetical protein OXG98_15325 [Gemmatimonadetes bacterium]|nr:hypothetical protein [Gemmatimonadota bacterium]